MKIFKQILSETTASLLLYGEISDESGDGKVSSRDFVQELMYLQGQYRNIEIRINSIGGDVYPGIAIYNAIANCPADVSLFVDGVAASIAGIIALCGRHLEMSKYSRIMLHNVSGGVFGNKNELREMIQQIEGLEDTVATMISKRCGKTPEDIKSMYFDGKDHFLTAQEAQEAGLIDGIYDAEPVPDDATTEDIYKIITNRLMKPQNNHNMKLEDVKKIPRFANCASEEDVTRILKETADKADRAETLEKENGELKTQIAAEEEKQIEAIVENAVKDGRLSADQKDSYKNILKADRENGEKILNAMHPKRLLKNEFNNNEPEAKSAWDRRQQEIKNHYNGVK